MSLTPDEATLLRDLELLVELDVTGVEEELCGPRIAELRARL